MRDRDAQGSKRQKWAHPTFRVHHVDANLPIDSEKRFLAGNFATGRAAMSDEVCSERARRHTRGSGRDSEPHIPS